MAEKAARPLDLITMGRAAVDLYGEQVGGRLEDMASFAKYVGGCPANIAVGSSRLGLKSAIITRVGDEHMGRFVRETLAAEGVDVSHVSTDPARLTGLVILGIRDVETFPLIFYRENCADMALSADEMDKDFIASASALLVTGTHFSTPSTDAACRRAMTYARSAGTKIVLDIDYRPVLWGLTSRGMGENRFVASESVSAHLQSIIADCDLIVGTEEEVHIAGGTTDTLAALRKLRNLSKATLVVKRGPLGCVVFPEAIPASIEDGIVATGFPVEVFNVLGAGDAFLSGLLRGWLRGMSWLKSCRIANACGALVVSRHGCAPAMPSWTELEDFLKRAEGKGEALPKALQNDERAAYMHRVTTGRRAWSEIRTLAFDHRLQFERLAARHGSGSEKIARFKALIGEAVKQRSDAGADVGVIVDDRFGRDVLHSLTGNGLWIGRPVEKPAAIPLAFEAGPDITTTLRAWPAEQIAKVLVVAPLESPADTAVQEERVAALARACIATGHELLLEIVPPKALQNTETIAAAMSRFYDLGIRPDWWKLPALADSQDWRRVGDIIRARDPFCRGIVILGQDSGYDGVAKSFGAAAGEPLVRGFAVGRLIFWEAAEAWFSGRMDDAAAVAAIGSNYDRVCSLWQRRRSAA
jgi:5-dehydro-2-deoxygluconokinase